MTTRRLTLEQLPAARKITESVSAYLCSQTQTYLKVLVPALVPHRLLGRHIEHPGSSSVGSEDRAWSQLVAAYRNVATKPYSIPTELESPLKPINPVIVLHPWEYEYEIRSGDVRERITVVCPTKWIVSYRSSFDAREFRDALRSEPKNKREGIQEFTINALVMSQVLHAQEGINELFAALRLTLAEDTTPETGALPFCTLTSVVSSQLPIDEVLLTHTNITGIRRFAEVITSNTINSLSDPLREHLTELLNEAPPGTEG